MMNETAQPQALHPRDAVHLWLRDADTAIGWQVVLENPHFEAVHFKDEG